MRIQALYSPIIAVHCALYAFRGMDLRRRDADVGRKRQHSHGGSTYWVEGGHGKQAQCRLGFLGDGMGACHFEGWLGYWILQEGIVDEHRRAHDMSRMAPKSIESHYHIFHFDSIPDTSNVLLISVITFSVVWSVQVFRLLGLGNAEIEVRAKPGVARSSHWARS